MMVGSRYGMVLGVLWVCLCAAVLVVQLQELLLLHVLEVLLLLQALLLLLNVLLLLLQHL